MLYGVDVHPRYQAGIDFPTLKAQGYTFAAVKATQGTYLSVDLFASWISKARAAGLIPGAYHWIVAGDGAGQARYFHERVKAAGGPDGMLIQLDCEDNATWSDVVAWANEWTRLTSGHPFLIYTGGWWWRPRTWNGSLLTPYLWDSHYLTADLDTVPDDPAAFASRIPADWWAPGYGGWGSATFLQFTSKGDAGGLGNNVDLNATRLTREQLLALTTGDDMPTAAEIIATDVAPGDAKLSLGNAVWYGKVAAEEARDLAKQLMTRPVQVDPAALAQALVADPNFAALLEAAAERAVRKVAADAAE